jgi:hypothetical protein
MFLNMVWPKTSIGCQIEEAITEDNAICFLMEEGAFAPLTMNTNRDLVSFYWRQSQLMICNQSQNYICLVNNQPVASGAIFPILPGDNIQSGIYQLEVVQYQSDKKTEIMDSILSSHMISELPQLNELLPAGSYLLGRELDEQLNHADENILKSLALEYKAFLFWGDACRQDFIGKPQRDNHLTRPDLMTYGHVFDKDKTLTECIIGSSLLIDKIIDELPKIDDLDIEAPPVDLLETLSPDYLVANKKQVLPSLIYQDLYKLGLDSYL